MSRVGERTDDADETSLENTFKFVLTLIVTTVIVAFAVYVLGSAMIGSGVSAPVHKAEIGAMHAHS